MTAQKNHREAHTRELPAYPIASVDNVLRLLLLFRRRREWRLSDIARELAVADSTAHRLAAMLEYHGFVRRIPHTKGYQVGPSIVAIGRDSLGSTDMRAVVRPLLAQIVDDVGETISLGVLEDVDIHYIDAIESDAVLRVGNRTGMKIPAHCTSAGKVLLAELLDSEIMELYPATELPAMTDLSIRTREELFAEIRTTRSRGFATSVAASEDGIASLAVPVRNAIGRVVASAALAAPVVRWHKWDLEALAEYMSTALAPSMTMLEDN